MEKISRRTFLRLSGLAVAGSTLQAGVAYSALPQQSRGRSTSPGNGTGVRESGGRHEVLQEPRYAFFSSDDAAFIEAAVERLIPDDQHGPGASHAGVTRYIDRQLAGVWDAGARLFSNGPWQAGKAQRIHQLPHTPAQLFRNALRGIEADLALGPPGARIQLAQLAQLASADGPLLKQPAAMRSQVTTPQQLPHPTLPISGRRRFSRLPVAAQDAYLQSLAAGDKYLEDVPSQVFFDALLSLTIEGFFSDPAHGGNEEAVARLLENSAFGSALLAAVPAQVASAQVSR